MLAMRIFGLIAYTAIGTGIGAYIWFLESGSEPGSLAPTFPIAAGAVIGLLVAIRAWVMAARDD